MARACCKYLTVSLVPVAALLLAILFALGILSLPILYTELEKKYEYGMVIDAGSSHTTLYIYKIDVPVTGDVEEIERHNVSKSLDRFAGSPQGARKLVEGLIQKANGSLNSIKVPQEIHNTTHIYLGATAGMRLLRRNNSNASTEILHAAKEAMKASDFKAKSSIIISGKEEAASGWLTANYIMDLPEKDLVGSLDLGGGSAEIAFMQQASPKVLGPHQVNVTLRNRTEQLYARSYLCYGHHEANARFLAHLIHDQEDKTVNVSDPCLAPNVQRNHTASKIYTYCVSNATAQDLFGYTLSPPPGLSMDSNVSFVGTGNVGQCWGNISKLFNYSLCDPEVNCANGATFDPVPANGTLVAYSGFHYIAKQLNISSLNFSRNGRNLKEVVEKNCTDSIFKSNKANDMCFYGLFMAHMLENGFGMNSTSHNDWTLVFKYKDKKFTFGWALGYLMNKTYEFPLGVDVPHHDMWPYSAVDMVIGMIILTILCVIFVVFFFLTFYACKKALRGHNGYQSIS